MSACYVEKFNCGWNIKLKIYEITALIIPQFMTKMSTCCWFSQNRSSQPVGKDPHGDWMTLSQGLTKTIRKHRYLGYDLWQW